MGDGEQASASHLVAGSSVAQPFVEPTDVTGDQFADNSSHTGSIRFPAWLDDAISGVEYSPSFGPDVAGLDDTVPEGYRYDREVMRAAQRLEPQPILQFWEHGFWAEIFGDNTDASSSSLTRSLQLYRPVEPLMPSLPEESQPEGEAVGTSEKRTKHSSYLDVVSSCTVQSWQEQRDSMWETAVRRWHSCIMSWKGDDIIVGLVTSKPDFHSQCQIVVDILHNKAPATLLKRCNSISRLVNDLHQHEQSFPCSEDELYDHLCRQREAGAPCSRLKSLLEAVTFVRHIFGVSSLEPCTKSRRCLGVATPRNMEVVRQAPPLRVEHLEILHHVMQTDEDPWNRCFLGMVLFCIYGRARWSDAQHSQKVEWDFDDAGFLYYVECSTAVHKTCRALNMRHSFLPLTAPGKGITDSNWALQWKESRCQLGIEDLSQYPLMPAPDETGQATVRPLSTSEAGKWLVLLLRQNVGKWKASEPLQYTSHSFKATTLSYLAKFGCSFEDRLALGYHVDQLRMALRYSRDGASRPLRVLEECLQAIRTGRFLPDVTRSGRFVGVAGETSMDSNWSLVSDVKQEETVRSEGHFGADEVVDLGSEHGTTCSESSSGDDAVVLPRAPIRTFLVPPEMDVWKHTKLKTVHLAPEGNIRILVCGRKITDKYVKGGVDNRFDVIKCKQCFNSILSKT